MLLTVALSGLLFAQQQPPGVAGSAPPPDQLLSPQQLEDLVAPMALYPIRCSARSWSQSTYPLEVVEAQQWLGQNRTLTGQKLMEAAQHQNWDPSIQALVAFPRSGSFEPDVRWTTDLGNAFLAQQADVMAAVQRLRASEANGKVADDTAAERHHGDADGQTAIQIQPVNPETVISQLRSGLGLGALTMVTRLLLYPPFGVGFGSCLALTSGSTSAAAGECGAALAGVGDQTGSVAAFS